MATVDDVAVVQTEPLHQVTNRPTTKMAFRFTVVQERMMVKAVADSKEYFARQGQGEKLFKEALEKFLAQFPSPETLFFIYQKPAYKTVCDRFKRLIYKSREQVRGNQGFQKWQHFDVATSGNLEVITDDGILLDDLIDAVDVNDETDRREKEEETKAEYRLLEAGDAIRVQALKRKREEGGEGEKKLSAEKKVRVRHSLRYDSDDDLSVQLLSHLEKREVNADANLKMKKYRQEVDISRARGEEEEFEKMQETNNRRLDLDEKRFVRGRGASSCVGRSQEDDQCAI